MTSCHHGDSAHPNNLGQAIEVIRCTPEIGILEIDFVQVGDDFISSHDYVAENIKNGSPLLQWIEQVVVKRGKTLWIDVKSHVDFMTLCGCFCGDIRFKFDCRALFSMLAKICNTLKQRVQHKVWLSCQDKEVRESFIRYNRRLKPINRWTIVTDIPFVYSYAVNACQYLLPNTFYSWIQDRAFHDFLTYNFEVTRIYADVPVVVCIDRSFFATNERIIRFVEDSTIPLGSIVVLYTFPKTEAPIVIPGYEIIMQYDYTPIARVRRKVMPCVQLNKSKSF